MNCFNPLIPRNPALVVSRLKGPYRVLLRTISLVVCIAFIVTSTGWSDGYSVPTPNPQQGAVVNSKQNLLQELLTEKIPSKFGHIKEHFSGTGEELIVHIQDAHCNYEAQTNSARILQSLLEKYKDHSFNLIGIEGASGQIDTRELTAIPHKEVKKQIAQHLLQQGRVSGAEYLSIMRGIPLNLFGVEDFLLYFSHLQAYKKDLALKKQVLASFQELNAALIIIKDTIYTKDLQSLYIVENGYTNGDIAFADYVKEIRKKANEQAIEIADFKNFSLLFQSQDIESQIDFSLLDSQRLELIEFLSHTASRDDISALLTKSLYYRLEKIESLDYFNYLNGLLTKHGFSLAKYPQLLQYYNLLKLFNTIDNVAVFEEAETILSKIKEALYSEDEQRQLNDLFSDITVLEGLFHAQLSRDDLAYFTMNEKKVTFSHIVEKITQLASVSNVSITLNPGISLLDKHISEAQVYYELARERDETMVKTLLDTMEKNESKTAVIVAGGFHSSGIAEALKEKNISYLIIAPKITEFKVKTPYASIMLDERSALDELVDQADRLFENKDASQKRAIVKRPKDSSNRRRSIHLVMYKGSDKLGTMSALQDPAVLEQTIKSIPQENESLIATLKRKLKTISMEDTKRLLYEDLSKLSIGLTEREYSTFEEDLIGNFETFLHEKGLTPEEISREVRALRENRDKVFLVKTPERLIDPRDRKEYVYIPGYIKGMPFGLKILATLWDEKEDVLSSVRYLDNSTFAKDRFFAKMAMKETKENAYQIYMQLQKSIGIRQAEEVLRTVAQEDQERIEIAKEIAGIEWNLKTLTDSDAYMLYSTDELELLREVEALIENAGFTDIRMVASGDGIMGVPQAAVERELLFIRADMITFLAEMKRQLTLQGEEEAAKKLIEDIVMGALLHEIGHIKLNTILPAKIKEKNGQLNEIERKELEAQVNIELIQGNEATFIEQIAATLFFNKVYLAKEDSYRLLRESPEEIEEVVRNYMEEFYPWFDLTSAKGVGRMGRIIDLVSQWTQTIAREIDGAELENKLIEALMQPGTTLLSNPYMALDFQVPTSQPQELEKTQKIPGLKLVSVKDELVELMKSLEGVLKRVENGDAKGDALITPLITFIYFLNNNKNNISITAFDPQSIKELLKSAGDLSGFEVIKLPSGKTYLKEIIPFSEGGMGMVSRGFTYDDDTGEVSEVVIKEALEKDRKVLTDALIRESQTLQDLTEKYQKESLFPGYIDAHENYLIMERVSGVTLQQILKTEKLSYTQQIDLVIGIAEALGQVHEAGYVFKDLKPSNIMVNMDSETGKVVVKLVDFGITVAKDTKSVSESSSGSPYYFAPEFVKGMFGNKEVIFRESGDIFAFALVVFEVFSEKKLAQFIKLTDDDCKKHGEDKAKITNVVKVILKLKKFADLTKKQRDKFFVPLGVDAAVVDLLSSAVSGNLDERPSLAHMISVLKNEREKVAAVSETKVAVATETIQEKLAAIEEPISTTEEKERFLSDQLREVETWTELLTIISLRKKEIKEEDFSLLAEAIMRLIVTESITKETALVDIRDVFEVLNATISQADEFSDLEKVLRSGIDDIKEPVITTKVKRLLSNWGRKTEVVESVDAIVLAKLLSKVASYSEEEELIEGGTILELPMKPEEERVDKATEDTDQLVQDQALLKTDTIIPFPKTEPIPQKVSLEEKEDVPVADDKVLDITDQIQRELPEEEQEASSLAKAKKELVDTTSIPAKETKETMDTTSLPAKDKLDETEEDVEKTDVLVDEPKKEDEIT
ncbi:protein kinase, partial [Chlamydiota bacterium]